MRILILSDLHSAQKILVPLRQYLENQLFDLILIAGDLTTRSAKAMQFLVDLETILASKHLPWQAIHGNSDAPEIIEYLKIHHHNLHFKPYQMKGYNFLGIGGFGDELPPYELKLNDAILLTHIPPRRHAILKPLNNAPLIHISGHIHRLAKYEDIGKTRFISIPSALNNKAAILRLPSRKVQFIHFD